MCGRSSVAVPRPALPVVSARKQIVIRPFKVAPAPPESFVADTTARLDACLGDIHAGDCAETWTGHHEALYRAVQNMCLMGHAQDIYARLVQACQAHTQRIVATIAGLSRAVLIPAAAAPLIVSVARPPCRPGRHGAPRARRARLADALLADEDGRRDLPVPRPHVRHGERVVAWVQRRPVGGNATRLTAPSDVSYWRRSIRDLGLSLFRREIAQGDTFDRVVAAILDLVRDERNGAAIGTTLVANVVTMTRECSLYADLESKFLDATNAYYMGEGARLCDSDDRVDVPEYLQHVMERLSQESTRISTYMHEESRLPCVQVGCPLRSSVVVAV